MPTIHLDRNDGTGREVCREDPARPSETTLDIKKYNCQICRRVLVRCLLDGEPSFRWRPRCALCNAFLSLHDAIEEKLPGESGVETRLVCDACYARRHPASIKYALSPARMLKTGESAAA